MPEEPTFFARVSSRSRTAKRGRGKCGLSGKNAFILTQMSGAWTYHAAAAIGPAVNWS